MADSMTPLETLVSLALNARLRGQSLTLAPLEVESLCNALEELVTLKARLRQSPGRPRIETDNPKTLAQRRWRERQK